LLFKAVPLCISSETGEFPKPSPILDALISAIILDCFNLITAEIAGIDDQSDSISQLVFGVLHGSTPPSKQDTNEGEHGDTGHGDDDALKFRFLGRVCVGVLMIVHDDPSWLMMM